MAREFTLAGVLPETLNLDLIKGRASAVEGGQAGRRVLLRPQARRRDRSNHNHSVRRIRRMCVTFDLSDTRRVNLLTISWMFILDPFNCSFWFQLVFDPALRERHMGDLHGLVFEDAVRRNPEIFSDGYA